MEFRTDAEPDPNASDPAPIVRLHEATAPIDTVVHFPVPRLRRRRITPGGIASYEPFDNVVFQALPTWVVAQDGWIAFVFPEPFRVELYGPDGSRRAATEIAYDPIRLTSAHRELWLNRPRRPGFTRIVTGGTTRWVRRPAPGARAEPDEWPEFLPPFTTSGFIGFAPDGNLWIQRTTPAADPPTFDVVDRTGRVIERVRLPDGRRLLSFGAGSLYAVRRDEMDLEYLERYRLSR